MPDPPDAEEQQWIRHCRAGSRRAYEPLVRRPLTPIPEALEPATDGGMGGIGSRVDLERGLDGLPSAQREVLVMKHVEGFAHHEITERLGIPPGTAMSRLHAARRRLAGLLGNKAPRGGTR